MNHQWYADDNSCSAAASSFGEHPVKAFLEHASPLVLTSQIRELLGDDCEMEASFLEECWASGQPMASAVLPRKRDRAAQDDKTVTFADLNTLAIFFSPVEGLTGDRPAHAATSANAYSAAWLRDPLEKFASRRKNQPPVQVFPQYEQYGDKISTLDAMTHQRACELLGVSRDGTSKEIRAAYRRSVSEWHPDRLEQSSEQVRAFATRQMAAINGAYHLLRDLSIARVC